MDQALILCGPTGDVIWSNALASKLLHTSSDDEEVARGDIPTLRAAVADVGFRAALTAVQSASAETLSGECNLTLQTREIGCVQWRISRIKAAEATIVISLTPLKQQTLTAETISSTTVYRHFFENALEGFFRSTVDGRYLEVNPALAAMYGYRSPADLVDRVRDLNTQLYTDPARRAEFLRKMLGEGSAANFESEITRADGSTIWIKEFARTVFAADGTPAWFEGSVIDITEQKRAEQVLKATEERFRRLLEMTNVLPWEADAETWRFTYVGPQAAAMFGYPRERWFDENFWIDHVHPNDRSWVCLARQEAIGNGRSLKCEYRMSRADDGILWVREVMSLTQTDKGESRIVGFMLDVTKREETEESLRESRLLIEQIASSSPVILYVYNLPRCECLSVRGRALKILGYSDHVLETMQPLFTIALAHPEEISSHFDYLARLAGARDSDTYERDYRLRGSDGRWIWLRSRETVFKRDRRGLPREIVGAAEDITLRRHAREELEKSEALFRKLAETTKVIPFELDPKTWQFTYVGPQAPQLLGWPINEWYREGFLHSVIHPDDVQATDAWLLEIDHHREHDFEAEFRIKSENGSYLWIRQIVNSAADADDRKHVRGFLFDITAAKENEQERERSRAELRELAARNLQVREEERTTLARELHDDLGQALTLFRLELGGLRKGVEGEVPANFRAMREKVADMERLIDGTLRTLREITSSLRPPLLDELGLADALEWHVTEFSRRTGIGCKLALEEAQGSDSSIGTVLFRICQEALTNVARHAHATEVRVELKCNGQNIALIVRDNGRGMSLSASNRFGLLGMRERAWAVGGSVEITSEPGSGTTVCVSVPAKMADKPQAGRSISEQPSDQLVKI